MDKQTREQNNQVSDIAQQKEVATASDLPKEEGKFNQVLSKILGKIKGAWIVVKGKTVIVYNKVCNKVKSIIKNLKEKKNTKQDKKEQAIEKVETPTNAKKVKQKAKKSTEKASIDLKKIFNARNIRIASIVLASVFCLLGAIQVCLFGYGIYNNINYILEIVKQKDIYALLCLAIAVIFILVLITSFIFCSPPFIIFLGSYTLLSLFNNSLTPFDHATWSSVFKFILQVPQFIASFI